VIAGLLAGLTADAPPSLAVCLYAGLGWFLLGAASLTVVCCSGIRARRARAAQRHADPLKLTGRPAAGVHAICSGCSAPRAIPHGPGCPEDELAVARAFDVDRTPDGSHENRSDVDSERYADELLWLFEQMPEAELLGLDPDAEGDVLPPPIVPGRDFSWGSASGSETGDR